MNWQRQVHNFMGQTFPPYNQIGYHAQLPPVNGYNGWNSQINQKMNFTQNMVRFDQNPFFSRGLEYPGNNMVASMPLMRPQITTPLVQPRRQNLKRSFQDVSKDNQRAMTAAGNKEEGTPRKKKRQKHSKFTSLSAMSPEMSYDEKLSSVIWKNYTENRQTDRTYELKQSIREKLCGILDTFGPNCVHIVGSTMNGFGSEKSDCDMCLHISSEEKAVSKRMTQTILFGVQRALEVARMFSEIQFIPARVPILKFRDRSSGIECDLNVNNTAGVLNTRLLALYANFDWRVRPLAMFVKHWGRLCDIHDASRGRLSSYSLNLMVIQYLQHGCSPAVLPSLQNDHKDLFKKSGSVHIVDASMSGLRRVVNHWRTKNKENTMSLGQLFTGFVAYFIHRIDFSKLALSVRIGRPIPIHVAMQQMPDDEVVRLSRCQSSSKMFIEEPFTLLNASRSPYDDTVFSIVVRAFQKTHRLLKLRKDIMDVGPV